MAYPQGFTYVSGPVFIREFNSESTATYAALQPVMLSNNNFKITESSGTASSIVGFSQHRAVDSVPAGKVLVSIPADRTVYASICSNNVAASALSSGATIGMVKSGNTFYLQSSAATALFVVVPREDGSTIDSADSSVWIQVLTANQRVFGQASATITI